MAFMAVSGFFAIPSFVALFAMAALFVYLAGVGGQFLGPIAEARGLQMLDSRADVFHPVCIATFAFTAFAFAAFASTSKFGDGVLHVFEHVGGFFFFAGFAQFGDAAFLLVDPFAKLFVVATVSMTVAVFMAFAVGRFVAFASVAISHGAAVVFQFLAGALGKGLGLVGFALFAQGVDLFFALLEPRFQFAGLAVAFAVAVAGSFTFTFAGFVALAVAAFVVVVGHRGPSKTHAGNEQRGHQGD